MKAHTSADSPAAYLAAAPLDRQQALQAVHDAITKAVPKLKPAIHAGMIGYGTYHYKYASGREGDWPIISLANQKHYISVYICAADPKEGYLAEANQHRLGNVSVGRSCIRFKKLEDINLEVLAELCKRAEQLMGSGHFAM